MDPRPRKKINDNCPDLTPAGAPTERQIAVERVFLFWTVLKSLGVPFQLITFIWKIHERQKPGRIYHWTDYALAEDYGGTTRNHICNLRKKLKSWQAETYGNGVKHYDFVSITDNVYNPGNKTHVPTGYEIPIEFDDLLFKLTKKIRSHRNYKTNWMLATKLVCEENRAELREFGYVNERKQKRPRSLENVLGTLVLNIRRLSQKFIEETQSAGFSGDVARQYLEKNYGLWLDQALAGSMPLGAPAVLVNGAENNGTLVNIPGRVSDYLRVLERVDLYVFDRENKGEAVIPKSFRSKTNKEENGNYDRRTLPEKRDVSFTGSDQRRDSDPKSRAYRILDNKTLVKPGESEANNDALDRERKRFLERFAKVE